VPVPELLWDGDDSADDEPGGRFAKLAAARGMTHLDLWDMRSAQLSSVLAGSWLTAVVILVLAAQPRRKTKWAWFWAFSLPLGLGVAWWLLREHPWSRRASALPEPLEPSQQRRASGGDQRATGGWMFCAMLFASIVASLIVPALSS
jgi:hypothetical protein